ncbi:MAG: hypothetical protein SF123_11060 [Chloroflexota bacterium]|nr:hypothetical protein [Chloroflexota bacterium]
MRYFQTLTHTHNDTATGMLHITADDSGNLMPRLSLKHEGDYVAISASYGPVEMALRPRYTDLMFGLMRLQPIEGLQTSRQVGSGQTYIALGLQPDGVLVLRPTLIGDGGGHITLNLALSSDARATMMHWLEA